MKTASYNFILIQKLNSVFKSRLSLLALAGWFVMGFLFGPPTRFLIFWTNSGASPYGKTALNATPHEALARND